MPTTTPEPLHPAVQDACTAFHAHSTAEHPDGGLCLVGAAYTGYVAHTAGAPATVVRGSYRGAPHWWLEVGGWRVDPTLHQFVPGAGATPTPVTGAGADVGYEDEGRYRNGYTSMEVVRAEAERAFVYPAAAHAFLAALPAPATLGA